MTTAPGRDHAPAMSYAAAPDRYDLIRYRRCGRSGLKLPEVSPGFWQNSGSDRPLDLQRATVMRAESNSAPTDRGAAPSTREAIGCWRLAGELLPVPLRDDLDGAVGHFDGCLVVDGVGRAADLGGPALGIGDGVLPENIQVREDREVDDAEGAVVGRGRPLCELGADPGRHHHAPGAHSDPDRAG